MHNSCWILDLRNTFRKDIFVDNQRNLNRDYILNNMVSMLNFLGMIMVCVCKRMFLFLRDVWDVISCEVSRYLWNGCVKTGYVSV